MGAERGIEVNISNKTFEQNGAKITFNIYNDSCLQTIACCFDFSAFSVSSL